MVISRSADISKNRILVIDDDDVITGLVTSILIKDGYIVFQSNDGKKGLKKALEIKPDLILMDIDMPGLSGYEATQRLMADPSTEETPVVFVSGSSADEDGGRSFEVGGATLLRKPFTNQQLRDVVRFCIEAVCK